MKSDDDLLTEYLIEHDLDPDDLRAREIMRRADIKSLRLDLAYAALAASFDAEEEAERRAFAANGPT